MNHPTEVKEGGLVTWHWFFIPIIFILSVSIIFSFIWNPFVSGEKRWATYTGTLLEFDIDCEQCCHPSSYFRINTSNGVNSELVGNCNEDLEDVVHVGSVYTIRIEPYAEPSAITVKFGEPSSFWCVQIDWIKDSTGNVIYGSEWF